MTAWAAALHAGPPVALAELTAARWLDLHRAPQPLRPQLVVPNNRHPEPVPWADIRRVAASRWRVRCVRDLEVTTPAVTIRDVAAYLPRHEVRDIVQHALRRRQVSIAALDRETGPGLAGSRMLRSVLDEVRPGYQVRWERDLHRALLGMGVRMTPQVKVEAPDGRTAYIDLGIARLRFGVEIDGFVVHMDRFEDDRRRGRMLAVELGWRIATFTSTEVATRLDAVAREVVAHVRRLEAAAS
jgi:very-short-patch-repair endonuclease